MEKVKGGMRMTRHERETLKEICGLLNGLEWMTDNVDMAEALQHARGEIGKLLAEDDE